MHRKEGKLTNPQVQFRAFQPTRLVEGNCSFPKLQRNTSGSLQTYRIHGEDAEKEEEEVEREEEEE